MPTTTIDVKTAPLSYHDLVTLIQAGEEVLLVDGETLLARVIPAESAPSGRIPGLHTGQIWANDDFDDPLPDEFWADQS
jgi:antitoxin (DNA-binding transcriptional repressor) of toxin-antitoxin stability system